MSDLSRLERIHRDYGGRLGADKRALLHRIERSRLPSAARVFRFHEILLYLRAYPDDAALLAATERALRRFSGRADLRRFRGALRDSGIAGTAIRYRFFWPMARWLASRWPGRLRFDEDSWDEFEPRLRAALPLVSSWVAGEAIRRSEASTGEIVERLRGGATGATWMVGRLERLPGGSRVREFIHDGIDATYVLDPGPGGPSRTEARWEGAAVEFRERAPDRVRPDLREEIGRPPSSVRRVGPRDGRRLIDLARASMVTRGRDLDAFTWGNPNDVRLIDDGGGLSFAMIGLVPERRLPLPAVHGWLTLRNGVPIGYVQTDSLLRGCEVAFNTFDTFRGGEAAHVFARVLASARHVLGARAFSIEPYQLGHGNSEGLHSGAWWFYAKLGFRPKDRAVARLHARERDRMRRDRSYRSDEATLERLARKHLYWEPDRRVPALLPLVPPLGLRLPAAGAEEAAAMLGIASLRGWSAAERIALQRFAPIVASWPVSGPWTAESRRALASAIRAKGGPDEILFLERLDAHPGTSRALARLLTGRRRESPSKRRRPGLATVSS